MADAFEAAWNVVKERPVNPNQPQFIMPEYAFLDDEAPGQLTDSDLEFNDGDDECCREVKDNMIALFNAKPDDSVFAGVTIQEVIQRIDMVDCQQLQMWLEALVARPEGSEPAKELLQMWDECSSGSIRDDSGFERSDDAFEDAWALSKKQPGIKQAWETLESGDSMPAIIPGLSGNKSKRHYQKFLTDAFGRTGSEELAEPNIGGGGGVMSIRPHVAYIGNDWNRYIPNLFRNIRDMPDALRWNPEDYYTLREGDPRTFPDLTPGGPIVDLPPVSPREVALWHDITGGMGLDDDQMYASNIRYYELRRKLNEMMHRGKWRTDPDESAEMARLTSVLLPQMIGGHFRIGDEDIHPLNIGPRGPTREKKDLVATKYPEAQRIAQGLTDTLRQGARDAGITGSLPGINTFLPYKPQRFSANEEDWHYDPWSREMRDKKYHFHEGDHIPFLEAVAPYLSPEYKSFLLSDPPYYAEPGEHKAISGDTGEVGGFTHNLMSAIRPIVDRGVPTVAFNSARMPKHLWETGGLSDYQVLPRNEKGIAGKGKQVMEVVGTANIPGMSQEMVNEMQTWPDSEVPIRGFYRHNVFGR